MGYKNGVHKNMQITKVKSMSFKPSHASKKSNIFALRGYNFTDAAVLYFVVVGGSYRVRFTVNEIKYEIIIFTLRFIPDKSALF